MKSINDYTSKKYSELLEQTGAFYAFGKSQFLEKKQPNVKYVSFGTGLLCPKSEVEKLISGISSLNEEGITKQQREYSPDEIISYAYFNFESQLANDTTDAKESLESYCEKHPLIYSEKRIDAVFKDCFALAVEKDWF